MNWFFLHHIRTLFIVGGLILTQLALWGVSYLLHGHSNEWWAFPIIITGIVMGLGGAMCVIHGLFLKREFHTWVSWGGDILVRTETQRWVCRKEHFEEF